MALQAMKDGILNEIVLSAAIAMETSHRDPGDQPFWEGPESRNPVLAYMVSLGPGQMIAGMTRGDSRLIPDASGSGGKANSAIPSPHRGGGLGRGGSVEGQIPLAQPRSSCYDQAAVSGVIFSRAQEVSSSRFHAVSKSGPASDGGRAR